MDGEVVPPVYHVHLVWPFYE